jgi:sterol desaturase/sphingolipid hydroxylase (fatty acid hydroxylase superfamily)
MAIALVLAPLSWVAGVWLLVALGTQVPAVSAVLPWDLTTDGQMSWLRAAAAPLGVLGATSLVLLLELAVRGWQASAARRLFVVPSASARVDLFYLVMRVAGGLHVAAFVLSFGTVFWIARQIHTWLGVNLLRDAHWALQFVAVYLIHSLVFYWGHRLMHTRWFWSIHKVHHAAEELNVVTPLRNHPIDLVVMTVLHTGPAALIGASPLVILAHAGVNAVYQALVHSELHTPRRAALWDAIWITPAAHRLHHSSQPAHFNHNFGILTVWDRVFGTYLPPSATATDLSYGVDDGAVYNRPQHMRELWANVGRWLGRGRP